MSAKKGEKKEEMSDGRRPEPEFYRVIANSFLVGQKIYKEGDLIPRGDDGFKFDYALGHGLIELYEPEEEEEPKPSGIRALASRLALVVKRA